MTPDTIYYGNSVQAYAIAIAVALVVFAAASTIRAMAIGKLNRLVERSQTRLDDLAVLLVRKVKLSVILVLSLYAGSLGLSLAPEYHQVLQVVAVALFAVQMGLWASTAITFLLDDFRQRKESEGDSSSLGAIMMLAVVARMLAWILVGLLILDNLGIDVTALVAGLGIGGLAVALAVKNVLSDLLSSVSIMLDKPFEVGDAIVVGDLTGTVEHIGIRSTRLRAPSGEQLVFGNDDLLGSRIRNMKRRSDRRSVIQLSLGYATASEKIAAAPEMVRSIIESQEHTRFDRAHIRELGSSAIILEAVYYMTDLDFALFMDIQQKINLEILDRCAREQIEIAYPTQTVHVRQD